MIFTANSTKSYKYVIYSSLQTLNNFSANFAVSIRQARFDKLNASHFGKLVSTGSTHRSSASSFRQAQRIAFRQARFDRLNVSQFGRLVSTSDTMSLPNCSTHRTASQRNAMQEFFLIFRTPFYKKFSFAVFAAFCFILPAVNIFAQNFEWAKRIGGTQFDSGYSLAIDTLGNVYTTGIFQGTADFDPGAGTFNLTSAGLEDIFISKLDSAGNFVWARRMGGASPDWGHSIALDAAENVYTTGYFEGTVDFDPGAGTFNLTSAGHVDIFVCKFGQYPCPTIVSTISGSRCGTITLGATASAGIINWYANPTGGVSLGTGTSFTTPSISTTTTYYIDATDAVCTTPTRTAVTATVNPNPIVSVSPSAPVICVGNSITITASGATTYNWSHGLGTIISPIVSPTLTTTYTVTGTDPSGCSGTASVTVIVNPNPVVNASSSSATICAGSSTTITATGASSYSWSHGLGTTASQNVSPTSTTTYTVTGTTAGCTGTTSVTVTVNSLPIVDLGADITLCSGDSTVIDASFGFSSYNWSTLEATQTITVNSSGTFTVTVTDTNGCQGIDAITVSVLDQLDATILNYGPFCTNALSVNFSAVDPGGVWSGVGITNTSLGTFNPSAAGSGTHNITYTISGTCGDSDQVSITVFASPKASVFQTHETCTDADDGWAYAVNSGGTPPYTWIWSNGMTTDTIQGLSPDTYSYHVTDNNGCQAILFFDLLGSANECNPPHVYVPNIFSPNGDGENDLLYVRGERIEYLEFIIYNRWGQKIFESTSQDIAWDGRVKGNISEPGVYYYLLRITWSSDNERETFSGNVTLVR